jgi:protein TonB
MNTKYLLPATFAATVHAFVLFGLPGKSPVTVGPAGEPPPPAPLPPILTCEPLEPPPPAPGEGEPTGARTDIAPMLEDIPVLHPLTDSIFIPPTPKVDGHGPVYTIPVDWDHPRIGGNSTEVIDGCYLDHEPRARVQPAPAYPYEARHHLLEGTVVVEFLVDEVGNVYAPVIRSATSPVFVDAALRGVTTWKFEPGTKHGRRVRFRMIVPVEFRIGAD